jgi:NTE family protein
MSLPGVFAPVEIDGRLLVDGGLVNPVPTSVCRALGADVVIAVNLNSDIVTRKRQEFVERTSNRDDPTRNEFWDAVAAKLQDTKAFAQLFKKSERTPNFLDVLATSVNIMQDRITRSRMAGDPPNIILMPKLGHIRLLDYSAASEAIDVGQACVESAMEQLRDAVAWVGSDVDRRRTV